MYVYRKHPDEVIGGSQKVTTEAQQRTVVLYSTPTEVNSYTYKAVGEMHPSLQI